MAERIVIVRRFALTTLVVLLLACLSTSGDAQAACGALLVSAGDYSTLAISDGGAGLGWGDNDWFELGYSVQERQPWPVGIAFPAALISVSSAADHGHAVTADGRLWSWGIQRHGELGNGSANQTLDTPTFVGAGVDARVVSADGIHGLALDSTGQVWAWGDNQYGELGDGTNNDSYVPLAIPGLTDIALISAGGAASFVVKRDGSAWSFGVGVNGLLGNSQLVNKNTPVAVNVTPPVTAISGGSDHALALLKDGTVWAWGRDDYGELGDGRFRPGTPTPLQVMGLSRPVIAIAAGGEHSAAITDDGVVWGWGNNTGGAVGDGSTTDANLPVRVTGLPGKATAIFGGWQFSLAILEDGSLWAWGKNDRGQLGNGTFVDSPVPVQVLFDSAPPNLGNTLFAVRQATDVFLQLIGAPTSGWRIFADTDKFSIGVTRLAPVSDVSGSTFLDSGAVPRNDLQYYYARGLSLCSKTQGP